MSSATCRGPTCGARCFWKLTPRGRNILVDPLPDGTEPPGERFDPDTMTAHWATCPDAKRFRVHGPKGGGK